MCSKKEYYECLIRLAMHPKKPALTDVMLETLSIIAYKQPVTKADTAIPNAAISAICFFVILFSPFNSLLLLFYISMSPTDHNLSNIRFSLFHSGNQGHKRMFFHQQLFLSRNEDHIRLF